MENVCRTCLRAPNTLLSLLERSELIEKIATISSIQITNGDEFPKTICEECVKNINILFNFRKVIINSDLELRERYAAIKRCKENMIYLDAIKEEVIKIENEVHENGVDEVTSNFTNIPKSHSIMKRRFKFSTKLLLTDRRKSYECKECNFKCIGAPKWKHHRARYHNMGICTVCGKSMRKDNLHKHIDSHSSEPVTCEICKRIFKNRESLRSHKIKHRQEKYTCEFCGKVFDYPGHFSRHRRLHSGDVVKKKKCQLCGKAFYYSDGLNKHMQTHTGERPHPCKYCNRGFSSPYALKTHIRQHTNEKPYSCEHCPMAFPQKVSLITHLRSKHSIVLTK